MRCTGCATEWVSPQPTDERLAQIYDADYYEPWLFENADSLEVMKQRTFEPLLDQCDVPPRSALLDVGCATGSLLATAHERALQPFGIDRNEYAVAQARQRVPAGEFHVGVLGDDPFQGRLFDAITMVDFIEHVRDPSAEVDEARRRLSPRGVLALSTPRVDSLTRAMTRGAWPQYREEHLTYFSQEGLHLLLARCGFSVRSSRVTRKAVTLAYIHGQAQVYRARFMTPLTSTMYRLLPFARHITWRLPFGEMTVIATRER